MSEQELNQIAAGLDLCHTDAAKKEYLKIQLQYAFEAGELQGSRKTFEEEKAFRDRLTATLLIKDTRGRLYTSHRRTEF